MTALKLARLLGWFSLALGVAEIAVPMTLSRRLGIAGGPWLVRAFGVREIAAGFGVLGKPDHPFGPAARVAGDAMDIAVLSAAVSPVNPHRGPAGVALAMVLGVTVLDVLCTSALAADETRRIRTARRARAHA